MYKNHNFFRSDNEEAMALRQRCALDALEDVCQWLENESGEVAVSVLRIILYCAGYISCRFDDFICYVSLLFLLSTFLKVIN